MKYREAIDANKLPYPLVKCDVTKTIEPGYIICKHIRPGPGGRTPFYVELATAKTLGVVSCKECVKHENDREYMLANFTTGCAACLRQDAIIPAA